MEKELVILVNHQVQQAITNALIHLTHILPLSRSSEPTTLSRCRSLSNNQNEAVQEKPSRCSLPSTNNDSIHYQSVPNTNSNNKSKRPFDVQYSFSLNKPLFIKTHEQQSSIDLENFADQFVEHSIETVLHQINDDQHILDPVETFQTMNTYIDEMITSSDLEDFSDQITEDIIVSALTLIADDDDTIKDLECNGKSMDLFVNNLTKRIYAESYKKLREIFNDDDRL